MYIARYASLRYSISHISFMFRVLCKRFITKCNIDIVIRSKSIIEKCSNVVSKGRSLIYKGFSTRVFKFIDDVIASVHFHFGKVCPYIRRPFFRVPRVTVATPTTGIKFFISVTIFSIITWIYEVVRYKINWRNV